MTGIILAAGYATRLYPLTRNTPKPLLEVAGRSILDRVVDNALRVPALQRLIVVTNDRFYSQFCEWRDRRFGSGAGTVTGGGDRTGARRNNDAGGGAGRGPRVELLNDGTVSNESRLGAVSDLHLAVEQLQVDGDALVLAGDNLFDFELADFVAFFDSVGYDCITAHELTDPERLRRTGVVDLDDDGRVLEFAEKPAEPRSTWAAPPFYAYTRRTLRERLPAYLRHGGETDAPGSFIPWLMTRVPVYAFRFEGERYDIGNRDSYDHVCRIFSGY